ncbi:DUF1062 domain-containing protein [uncultured Alistipes sp.]|uniref:DUF1062 domain-containing protein n=1 Tax=uncultured Alistipes sp. TaxID=538949 RepID=UPI0027D9A817|nr:DUF1062 domain-containing protein [uncultured Alistipes sp.]
MLIGDLSKDIKHSIEMTKEYIWEIEVKSAPMLKKRCNHCKSNRFYCSEKFRINSQKRYTDVWLIYRCTECDNTYNLTILSRTKPELIKEELFLKFSGNDETLAWDYAFSAETARKNQTELDCGSVEYEIRHDNISIDDILNSAPEITAFRVKSPYEFGLKLSSLIRRCLGLSANQLDRMIEAKTVYTPDDRPIKRQKARNGAIVLISKERLQSLYTDERMPPPIGAG